MKKLFTQFFLITAVLLISINANAAVSDYSFSQSTGTYTPITGGVVYGNATSDDQSFVDPAVPLGGFTDVGVGLPIGFTFNFNGTDFDVLAIQNNGWISLGNSAFTPSVDINSNNNYDAMITSTIANTPASFRNRIGGMADDLQAQVGAELRLETIGVAPNRVCVVQFTNYREFNDAGISLNFQIRLNETSNVVEIVYGSNTYNATTHNATVGLGGISSADFNLRQTATDWNATTQGLANSARSSYSTSVTPPVAGLTFAWTPPSCPSPAALGAFNITTSSASLYWNSPAGINQIELDTAGFALGTGGITSATAADTLSISGLSAATSYEFFVRTICGPGDTSTWSGPFAFSTFCAPYVAPYTESFDAAPLDVCASLSAVSGGPWRLGVNFTWNQCTAPTDHTGNGGSFISNDMSTPDAAVVYQLNDVDVSALTVPYLDLYHYMCGTYNNEVYIEAWDGSAWAQVGLINTSSPNWENYGYNLSSFTFGANLVRVRFRLEAGSTGTGFQFNSDVALDDISILEAPACLDPSNLAAANISADSADISWTENLTATLWEVQFDTAGFVLGTGNSVFPTGTPDATLTGLMQLTAYEFYVRAICAPGDTSNWSGPTAFNTLATCPAPSGLSVYGVTDVEASFTWTTGGASNFILEIGAPGFVPGSGTALFSSQESNDTATNSSLTSATIYEAYVRDYCGPGDSSFWVGPVSFSTDISTLVCGPGSGSPTFVYVEDFDTDIVTGPGGTTANIGPWTQVRNTDPDWTWDSGGGTPSSPTGPSDGYNGGSYVYLETSGSAQDADTLTSSAFDLSLVNTPARLRFFYHMFGEDIGTMTVETSGDGGATWNPGVVLVGQQQTSSADAWKEAAIDVTYAVGSPNFLVRWVGTKNNGAGPNFFYGDMAIDFVRIEACVSCISPSNVTAVATSADSALITFDTYSGATNTMIEYGPAPLTPGTGIMTAITNDTLILTGLSAATTYEVLIASDCSGSTGDSSTADLYSFTTLCATFVAPYFQDFDALPLVAPFTQAPVCWEAQVGPDFWDATNGTTNAPQYLPGVVDHTSGSGNFMWIDASTNITANEMVTADIDISALTFPVAGFWVASNNVTNAINHTIALDVWDGAAWVNMTTYIGNSAAWVEVSDTIPAGIPSVTRFRIYAIANPTGTTANYFQNDLGVDDFFVYEAPTCPGVANLNVDSVATDIAVLSWTENGGATQWFVEVVPAGSTPGTGTLVSANPYTVTGLSSNVEYDFYVQSYCGPADSSFVFNGGSFTTLPECGDTVGNLIYSLTNTAEVLVSFQGPLGQYVSLEFLAGQVETCCDEVLVYDGLNGTGNILYGSLTGGGLADYSGEGIIESQTGQISLVVNSDVSVTAASAGYTPFEVALSCFPPPPFEIGVTEIISPESGCGQVAAPLQIVVENFGTSDVFYAPVVVELTGDITAVYSLVIDSLFSGEIDTIELSILNTSAGGTVTFNAFTNLANDGDTSNDTTQLTFEFGAVPMAPMIADIAACDGDSVLLGYASLGLLSWFETDTSSSPFFQGDTLGFNAADTTFYVSQQEEFNGDAVLDMFDSFGDGWNGATLEILVNGVPAIGSPFSIGTGSVGQALFPVSNGDSITLNMTSGTFDNEISYTLTGPNGAVIFEDGFAAQITIGQVYNDVLVSVGCPSSQIQVNVTVNPTYLDTVVMSACDSMTIGGVSQTTSGFYTDSLTSVSGCDSIVVFDLTINTSYDESVGATICDNGSYTLPDGSVVSTAGLYTTVLTAANGCDSTIKTQVVVVSSFAVSQNVQLCAGDTLTVGTNDYTASGSYIDTLLSLDGCDSLVTSNVVVFTALDVSIAGVTVVCENAPAVDLTLDPLGGTLSGPGVTGTSFDPAAAGLGTSTLVYTFSDANGCDATASLDVEVVVCTGIENIEGIETISIFPNPFVSTINVMFEDAIAGELTMKLMDITGRTIMFETVNTSVGVNNFALQVNPDIASGVTFLQIERDGAVYSTTLIKE